MLIRAKMPKRVFLIIMRNNGFQNAFFVLHNSADV